MGVRATVQTKNLTTVGLGCAPPGILTDNRSILSILPQKHKKRSQLGNLYLLIETIYTRPKLVPAATIFKTECIAA